MIEDLRKLIRDIPDFPKKGIIFKDITPLLQDAKGFAYAVDRLCEMWQTENPELIAGIESRGFIIGAAMASKMQIGFVPLRKPGKLPYKTKKKTYSLEYGTDSIEIHDDALKPGQKVLLVDDVIATGGTAKAAAELIRECGGKLVGITFLIELSFLKGKEKLVGENVRSLIVF